MSYSDLINENNAIIKILKEKETRKKEILRKDEYILWLMKFSEEYSSFYDSSWLCNPEDISFYDFKRVNELGLLYEIIYDYAAKNFLMPSTSIGEKYFIKYEDFTFSIEALSDQGSSYLFERIVTYGLSTPRSPVTLMDTIESLGISVRSVKQSFPCSAS